MDKNKPPKFKIGQDVYNINEQRIDEVVMIKAEVDNDGNIKNFLYRLRYDLREFVEDDILSMEEYKSSF